MSTEIAILLRLLEQAFEKRAWHGTNLRGAIRGLTHEEAAWRPGPGRRNIIELTIHAAYWKYAIRRKLTGEKRGSFPVKGSNWFDQEDVGREEWAAAVDLLVSEHRALLDAVRRVTPEELPQKRGIWTVEAMITGAASHDLYHCGQIQLLKRLHRASRYGSDASSRGNGTSGKEPRPK